MTPAFSKFVFVMLAIGWYLIRYEYARRSRREKILRSDRGPWETPLPALVFFRSPTLRQPFLVSRLTPSILSRVGWGFRLRLRH
jgi:hypothetical protein